MIITLSGVTGVGKSYYKNYLVQNAGLTNMVIYTTREKRLDEIDGVDKIFLSEKEFEIEEKKDMFTSYSFLENKYGYSKKYIDENINSVTELHYEWIEDFKEKAGNVYSIYIIPTDIEMAKKQLKLRNLPKEIEKKRIKEIEEHRKKIKEDRNLINKFDYIFYNDFTEISNKKMLDLIGKIVNKKEILYS